jgi:hypothetical protein
MNNQGEVRNSKQKYKMCLQTDTIYDGCTCRIPEIECCPRCPGEGCEKCQDFKKVLVVEDGVCVGLGHCPFVRCADCNSEEESEAEGEERFEMKYLDEKKWLGWL